MALYSSCVEQFSMLTSYSILKPILVLMFILFSAFASCSSVPLTIFKDFVMLIIVETVSRRQGMSLLGSSRDRGIFSSTLGSILLFFNQKKLYRITKMFLVLTFSNTLKHEKSVEHKRYFSLSKCSLHGSYFARK